MYSFNCDADLLLSSDVVVVGGGTSGTFAAIAAAREGAKTVIIEGLNALGGTATLGLVVPNMWVCIEGEPQSSYLAIELEKRATECGLLSIIDKTRYYDPLRLSSLLEKMAVEAGVSICLYTQLLGVDKDKDKIKGIFVRDKAGIHYIEGKVFVDATGDGDLSVMAGASYTKGNPKTGKNQPISLRYIVGGIDEDAFHETAPDSIVFNNGNILSQCTKQDGKNGVEKIFHKALENGDLIPEDLAFWQIFGLPNRSHAIACNCPEFFDKVDGTNASNLTNAQLVGKQAIERHLAFYKKYFKGFEKAYLADVATMVGIRESREIVCDHVLTINEARKYLKFEDFIAQTNYPVDVHGFGDDYSDAPVGNGNNEKPYYEIPYGSIVVKDVDNLLVCGRCIGADFFVEASIRIIPTCRATGEAAGIASSICVKKGISPHKLNGKEVRKVMENKGAIFAK